MSVNKVNSTKHYIFEILTVIIMFAGFFMPEIETLPPFGVQVLFIFIGLVVGWSVVGLIMPSILGLIALAFTRLHLRLNLSGRWFWLGNRYFNYSFLRIFKMDWKCRIYRYFG